MLKVFQCQIIMYRESISEGPTMKEGRDEKMLDSLQKETHLKHLEM